MGRRVRRSNCHHCNELYRKDARNAWHQKYCSKPACRKASKGASQRGWLGKKDNKEHFRGAIHAQRVRDWQRAHPGYWKNKANSKPCTLQDDLNSQIADIQSDEATLRSPLLQDILISQHPVIVGLIATLTESTLQEDIASQMERYHARGADILGTMPTKRMNALSDDYEKEKHPRTQPLAADPVPV